MRICEKIVIIGLGLIGTSLGAVLKKRRVAAEIVGVSRKDSTLKAAREKNAVDWCTKDLKRAVKDADIIILATPVHTIINFASQLPKLISKDCIVSDAGSTKAEIVKAFEKRNINFVGAHPLAGSEKKGAKFADGLLFKDSLCLLTPTKNTNKKALAKIRRLWQLAGARTQELSPARHDLVLSLVSHVPHAVAFSLVETLPKKFFKYVPNGFKDTTRIAASDAQIWEDIFLSNAKLLLRNIDIFQKRLNYLRSLIKRKDAVKLNKLLRSISLKRSKI